MIFVRIRVREAETNVLFSGGSMTEFFLSYMYNTYLAHAALMIIYTTALCHGLWDL